MDVTASSSASPGKFGQWEQRPFGRRIQKRWPEQRLLKVSFSNLHLW
jgi:hypothetical protein